MESHCIHYNQAAYSCVQWYLSCVICRLHFYDCENITLLLIDSYVSPGKSIRTLLVSKLLEFRWSPGSSYHVFTHVFSPHLLTFRYRAAEVLKNTFYLSPLNTILWGRRLKQFFNTLIFACVSIIKLKQCSLISHFHIRYLLVLTDFVLLFHIAKRSTIWSQLIEIQYWEFFALYVSIIGTLNIEPIRPCR